MNTNNSVKHGRRDFMMEAPRLHFDVRKNDEGLYAGYEFQAKEPIPGTTHADEQDCIRATRDALWNKMKTGI